MEGGSLFNPGFLGASFNWWVGQIASDSTWRDNMLPGKFESKDQIPGWGRRYKVRIVGLHDREETTISSDQLPWAQVMYPVTGGGGQANASATANLRQGNFVFGFFLDGQEQQVPVIMGVLGSNAQTALSTKTGTSETNFSSTSGHATPADGNKDPNIKVPDEGLVINKPKGPEQSEECAPTPPGVSTNQFGLRSDKPLSKSQFRDQQSALAEADARGLTGTARSDFIQKAVADGIKARCQASNSPSSPSQPGATRENVDAVHEQSKADVVRNDYYSKKTSLMSPCEHVKSALKAIQIELDNLTQDIDKILNAAESYVDAVSNLLGSIEALISDIACKIAKYMKIVFNKIKEYVLKQINKALSPTIEQLPPNLRYTYFDVKESITELITCLYSKITNNLCGLIQGLLNNQIKRQLPKNKKLKAVKPAICSVEKLTGDVIALNMNEMTTGINGVLNNIGNFLKDSQYALGVVSGGINSVQDTISGVKGSITSALSFENIKINIFGCDLKPNCAPSDYYTLSNGSGAAEEAQQPRVSEVDKSSQGSPSAPKIEEKPYAQPSQNQPDILTTINQTTQFIGSI